ncbi:MAG: hypothetical protein AABW48_04525 [Nanoarchaeota archaeon]
MKIKIIFPDYTVKIDITSSKFNQRYQGREDQVYTIFARHFASAMGFLCASERLQPELEKEDKQSLERKLDILRSFKQSSTPTSPTLETIAYTKPKDPSKLN